MPTIALCMTFIYCLICCDEQHFSYLTVSYNKVTNVLADQFLCCDSNTNRNGDYSWTISYLLNADLMMFQSTGDTSYSNRFVRIASKIMKNRDDRIGVKDWKGKSGAGWSEYQHWDPASGKNKTGIPMRYAIDDAVILKPILDFAVYVREKSLQQYDSVSRVFIYEAAQVVDTHIRESWSVSKGCFIFPKGSPVWCDGANVPLNQAAQMGTVLMSLYSQTGNKQYRALVRQIADSVKSTLRIINGYYQWNYWGGLGDRGWTPKDSISKNTPQYQGHRTVDDVGHAALVTEFIATCAEQGMFFTREDVDKLIHTFRRIIDRGDSFANSLEQNSPHITTRTEIPAYKWMILARYDGSIAKRFYDLYLKTALRYGGAGNAYLIASLIYYSSLMKMELK